MKKKLAIAVLCLVMAAGVLTGAAPTGWGSGNVAEGWNMTVRTL